MPARYLLLLVWMTGSSVYADSPKAFDAAAAFGARQGVTGLSLSPDGKSVAYVVPLAGQGSALLTLDVAGGKAQPAMMADGKPNRMETCHWVSNVRLVCHVYGVVPGAPGLLPFSRLVAVDRSGSNMQMLSTPLNAHSRGYLLGDGSVVDWLPDQDGAVLMAREYLPDAHTGSRIGSEREGLGVDLIDTRSMSIKSVEDAKYLNADFITDGRGTVRVMGRALRPGGTGQEIALVGYEYRKPGSRDWLPLSEYNFASGVGFHPLAVDHELNVCYGLKKLDGRFAMYKIALDGSMGESLVYARPDVDVSGLLRIGRRNRVVGVTYETDVGQVYFLDPDIERLMKSLARALPDSATVHIVDSSVDENVLLIFASSDDDPGVYYIFDRAAKKLKTFLVVRSELEGVKLAKLTPVNFPAADGQLIPGYLTLPPGKETAKGLPAIVMPHGGPSSRDHWGFKWMTQYFANRGYAVLQPNYRGSAGYGDEWLKKNGIRSWRTAISDIDSAGHWLISQKIADPDKLVIVGWSYGGFAALQSAVTEPGLFKAVVAIAPVTDWIATREEWRGWSNFELVQDELGGGANLTDGSPARHADKIQVPVLLFHGAMDRNVGIGQSRQMASALESAGVRHELVTWDDLDHHLEDSDARAKMLRKSDEFIRAAIGGAALGKAN